MNHRVQRAAGIDAGPGEDDSDEDRDKQNDDEDLEEERKCLDDLFSQLLRFIERRFDRIGKRSPHRRFLEHPQSLSGCSAG